MEGLAEDTIRGHISLRSPEGRAYIKAWGLAFEEVTPENLLAADLDGNLIDGKGRLHSELPIHLEIYRLRPDISSVVHVHPYWAVTLSAVFKRGINIISQNGMHFAGDIPFYESPELIRTKEQGAELAYTMGDKLYVLMKNHGIVTAGRSLEEAAILAIDFEKAAREHLMVSLFGKAEAVSAAFAEQMSKKIFNPEQYRTIWDFYCRKLERSLSGQKQKGGSL
jgi:ribulose-5-phosphate 4-epimerase/fuculose-1-phosphate aldolase